MQLKNIDHINLTVADFETTVAWYGRVFGFELVEEDRPRSGCLGRTQAVHAEAREAGVPDQDIRIFKAVCPHLQMASQNEHIRFFTELTGLPASRFARVLVGEDDRLFPADPPAGPPPHTDE